jgi:hypothetical protein
MCGAGESDRALKAFGAWFDYFGCSKTSPRTKEQMKNESGNTEP